MFWLAEDLALLRKVRHRGTLKVDWFLHSLCGLTIWCACEPDAQHSSGVSLYGRGVLPGAAMLISTVRSTQITRKTAQDAQ